MLTRIDNQKIKLGVYFRELMAYRELLWILAFKEIKARFAQTFLGFFWSIVQPLLMLGVYTLVFHEAARISPDAAPYPAFVLAGMLVYDYFAVVLHQSGSAILAEQDLIQKVYFPRILIPVSKAILGLVDLMVNLVLIAVIMLIFGVVPGWQIVFLPVFLLSAILIGLTGGIWVSALTVRYRDLQEVLPFLVRLSFFLAPVVYPVSILPKKMAFLVDLNPLTGVIEGIRWCLFGAAPPTLTAMISLGVVALLFVGGILYFRRIEGEIADII